MQLIEAFAQVTESDGSVRTTITSEAVVIEALCALKDQLILSDDWDTHETTAKLMIIEAQIAEIWNQIPVR